MSKLYTDDPACGSTERDIYRELAEYKLSVTLLEQRLEMMTRMCHHYMEMRADLCRQLEPHGLTIAINNQLVETER